MHQVNDDMNDDDVMARREKVCALADGQLRGEAFAEAVALTQTDSDAWDTWHVYHLVGDVLRAGESGAWGHDRAFAARLTARLEAETRTPPRLQDAQSNIKTIAVNQAHTLDSGYKSSKKIVAANDSVFRWKLVAGIASFAAVATLGWNVMGLLQGPQAGAQLAQSVPVPGTVLAVANPAGALPSVEPVAAGVDAPPVMIRDPRLDELLAAHRQFGGASLLDNPSGFLRNATFETSAR